MKTVLAGIALIGTATCAQAADMPARAPYTKAPAIAAYNWTGFYLGANAGIGFGRNSNERFIGGNPTPLTMLSPVGAIGGGQIGYNWQIGSFIGPLLLGVEADIQGAGMSTTGSDAFGARTHQTLDWFTTVRGRAGLVTGSVVSYLTAGYAYGNLATTNAGAPGIAPYAFTAGRSGWVLGSGVEAALGGNWTAKLEHIYLDLGTRNDALGASSVQSKFQENIFCAGVNYRIGGNAAPMRDVVANWTGFYAGGNLGTGRSSTRTSIAGTGNPPMQLALEGITGGVQAGVQAQSNHWVYGIETDIQGSAQDDERFCIGCVPGTTLKVGAKLPWFGTLRGRVGYAFDTALFYATGGLAYGGVKTAINGVARSDTRTGWALGGGIETPFTLFGLLGPNWTSRSEYLYVDLGKNALDVSVNGTATRFTTHAQQHQFRTGLSYHFNTPVLARF